MSTTSKSPKSVAAAAYRVACETLPEHSHRYSPKKYTQLQLLVCLVLRVCFKTDYRSIVEILNDWPDLCQVFELETVPHFTTLQKASKRLLRFGTAKQLLDSTLETLVSTKTIETYRSRIKEKLSLRTGSKLLQHAFQWASTHDQGNLL